MVGITLKNSNQNRLKNVCSALAETKIVDSVPSSQQRSPDSSCSSSSVTEWDSTGGHSLTIRRLPPLPPLASRKPPPPPFYNQLIEELNKLPQRPVTTQHSSNAGMKGTKHYGGVSSTPNDKLPVLMESSIVTSPRLLYFSPEHEICNTVGDGSTSRVPSGIQDQLRTSQLSRLNRDLTPTISEVYHERSIGLGLAPSLTKLLLPQAEEPDSVAFNGDSNENSSSWLSSTELQRFYSNNLMGEADMKTRSVSPCRELSPRDEGDGRSIADSQCSAGSFKRTAKPHPPAGFDETSSFQKGQGESPIEPEFVPTENVSHKLMPQEARISKNNSSSVC